ncbi:hypothetical protein H6F93_15520 [Leptolyngbya sp. FACHB-671]|uniref:hypothetical protein n=1 Tax=Leptolyngbya sp. FACHB-671 TaxID=2692812 RepID=UPI0016844CD9|nr:hypothetical protein [Leptolyngbya sp. FACHB-671]MBD2068913.1 hypothetical protein [Leptolyngbya sp. FACHB-671]
MIVRWETGIDFGSEAAPTAGLTEERAKNGGDRITSTTFPYILYTNNQFMPFPGCCGSVLPTLKYTRVNYMKL